MQKLIIVLALATCCLAAPLEKSDELSHKPGDLIRPSPINPDIPSDPKPEEKITLITDPKVTPVTTVKPTKLPGPFVVPISRPLLRTRREDKDSSESDEKSSEEEKEKKSSRPLAASSASLAEKHAVKLSTTTVPTTTHQNGGTTSSTSTATIPTHPRIPYAPHIHQHNEHLFKPSTTTKTTEGHLSGSSSSSSSLSTSTSTTSATPLQDHANEKRDIPVPLTRKYHHSDDVDETKRKEEPSTSPSSSPSPSPPTSVKVSKEKINQEEKKDEGNKAEPVAVDQPQHPSGFARPIPVAELFAKKPSAE